MGQCRQSVTNVHNEWWHPRQCFVTSARSCPLVKYPSRDVGDITVSVSTSALRIVSENAVLRSDYETAEQSL